MSLAKAPLGVGTQVVAASKARTSTPSWARAKSRRSVAAAASVTWLLLAVGATLGCHESAALGTPYVGPRIAFDSLEHDFGHIIAGRPMTHRFSIRNTGDKTLVIHSVTSSCSCTATVLKNSEIQPGSSGQVEVQVTGKAAGPLHKQVSVTSNDPHQQATTLSVTAVVHPDLDYEPHYIKLITDDSAYRSVRVWFVGDYAEQAQPKVIRIEGASAVADQIRLRPLEERRDGQRRSGLELSLNPKVTGSGAAAVIVHTGLADPAQLAIPFSWGASTKLTAHRH